VDAFTILVGDNGGGFSEGVHPERSETFGLQLIHGLTSQVGRRGSFERNGGTSVRADVTVPISA